MTDYKKLAADLRMCAEEEDCDACQAKNEDFPRCTDRLMLLAADAIETMLGGMAAYTGQEVHGE